MGLIKAGMGALGGTLADQWKEFFYCDSLDKDVLMVKGQKRTSRRSSNNGEDNIITNGSYKIRWFLPIIFDSFFPFVRRHTGYSTKFSKKIWTTTTKTHYANEN